MNLKDRPVIGAEGGIRTQAERRERVAGTWRIVSRRLVHRTPPIPLSGSGGTIEWPEPSFGSVPKLSSNRRTRESLDPISPLFMVPGSGIEPPTQGFSVHSRPIGQVLYPQPIHFTGKDLTRLTPSP